MACPSCAHPVPEGARFCPSCGYSLAPGSPDERRVVTVLFADLVGFTALAEKRDPEQVKRLVDAAFERLVDDVELFGGRVDKVLGDAIVALFGAPVAHEDDAERAVRSALRMHETLCEFMQTRSAEVDVRLRIGINTGEVLVGTLAGTDYTAMGDVMNIASRLQSLAPPGGVLVGSATRALCSDGIVFEPLEPAQLRGRERIEEVWLAVGTDAPAGVRRRRTETAFIGRAVERTLLDSITALVADGRSAVVSVVGEAGIGKTRLIDEALRCFVERHGDVAVFDGACAPYGEANVWWPIATGVANYYGLERGQSADDIRTIVAKRSAGTFGIEPESRESRQEIEVLLHLLGHPSELDRLDPAGARDAVFTTVIAALRRRTAKGPAVLFIDDLHWSHALLRELLEVIARSLADLPLLIVTASRPTDEGEWPPHVDRALTFQLPLGPLSEQEAAALIDAVAGSRAVVELGERLYDRSGGNPLFLSELALLATTGDEPSADAELPGSLRALIASRLDQLAPDHRAVVDNAAILGNEGSAGALVEFANAMHQRFEESLVEDLAADGLLELDGGCWRFRSDVVREVAYQTLTKQARAQRHAGVASVMARGKKAPIDDLAHHAASAAELLNELGSVPGVSPAIRAQAVEYLTEAAGRSYDLGGFRHGVGLAHRALGLTGDSPDARRGLLLLHAAGLVELRSLTPARADVLEVLDSAAIAGDRVSEGEAHRLMGTIEQLDGDLGAARDHLGTSVEIFRKLDDGPRLAQALRARGFAEVFGGSLQDAEWFLGEADAIFEELDDARGRAWIAQNRAWVSFLSGDNVGAEERLDGAIATFEQIGDHSGVTWARGLLAFVNYFQRRFDVAESLATEVLGEAQRWGDDWGMSMMLTLSANLRLWTGRFAEAVQFGERALAGFKRTGDRFGVLQALAPLNRARAALGRTGDAERGIEEVLSLSDAFRGMGFPALAASGVAMHLGQGRRAVELASQAVDRIGFAGGSLEEASVQLSVGQLQSGEPDAALATLLGVEVESSPFALAARALTRAALADHEGAIDDADRASALEGSYFDRLLAEVAAASAAAALGRADAHQRLSLLLADADASGDVIVAGFARAVARRLGASESDTGEEPALPPGWRCVVDQIAGE